MLSRPLWPLLHRPRGGAPAKALLRAPGGSDRDGRRSRTGTEGRVGRGALCRVGLVPS